MTGNSSLQFPTQRGRSRGVQGPFALGVGNRQVRWIAESWSVRTMAISRHLGLSAPPLLRREMRSLRPPLPWIYFLSGRVSG